MPSPARAGPSSMATDIRTDPRWILLPLRAFLGFTFLYAGLSKIGNRSFLDKSDPSSMYSTLVAVKAQSPIGGLLSPVEHHSLAFGLLMALGETAVGVGILAGLFTRIAASGGMVLSLSLFLTVSWGATPWYTGADIVYVFAFTALLLGGAGPLSADGWLASARSLPSGGGDLVAEDKTRRVLLGGLAGLAGLVAVGTAALFRGSKAHPAVAADDPRTASPSGSVSTTSGAQVSGRASAAGGKPIIAASAVPVGGAKQTKDPLTGDAIYVLQLEAGQFTALDTRCPHQGCAVSFISKSVGFQCPCHQSEFDSTGAVTRGPATSGLSKIAVSDANGEIVRT
jgi:thiosulfate dehydrogenase [quinone] large subunit